MPVGATVGAGVVTSLYAANKNSQAQSAAMGAQQGAANSQLQLQQDFMNQQNAMYGPLMSQYVQQASGNQPLDYGLMSGQIQGNYDAAQRNLKDMLAARGISASGLSGAGATGLEIGRAGALSQAFQQGLDRRRQLGLNVLQHYNPAANVQGVAGAYGNLQNMYGQYAGMYGQAAGQGYGAAGQALGNLGQYLALRGQAPPPGTEQPEPSGDVQPVIQATPVSMPIGYGLQEPQNNLLDQTTPLGTGGYGGYFGDQFQPFLPMGPSLGYGLGATTTGAVR